MINERPETLLKSALEKIVYFEARSTQLTNDVDQTRGEALRLKNDLAAASQREIELRRVVAELEVRATRAHSEREDAARLTEHLRRERAELIGKILEASRIHRAGEEVAVEHHDLAQFIAELRAEVLEGRAERDALPVHSDFRPTPPYPSVPRASAPPPAPMPTSEGVRDVATMLRAEGRLGVTAMDLARLENAAPFPGRTEETLFGFSVRELSAPDTSARVRAAERLQALAQPAAAPALATALHAETEPVAQVALLAALATFARAEAVPVVQPLLSSPSAEVRVAALKALLVLDPAHAGPHLAAATKDPDKAVRRRASLLALGLQGAAALELGAHAVHDVDADVRSLAALVLGASGAEAARPYLVEAMNDRDGRVVKAAAQALSRVLGQDVTGLATLDDAQRRREVRRLAQVTSNPVRGTSAGLEKLHARLSGTKTASMTMPQLVAPRGTTPAAARSARRPLPPPPASLDAQRAAAAHAASERMTGSGSPSGLFTAAQARAASERAGAVVSSPGSLQATPGRPASKRTAVMAAALAARSSVVQVSAPAELTAAAVAGSSTEGERFFLSGDDAIAGGSSAAPSPSGLSAGPRVSAAGRPTVGSAALETAGASSHAPGRTAVAVLEVSAAASLSSAPASTGSVAHSAIATLRTAEAATQAPATASFAPPAAGVVAATLLELRSTLRGRSLDELAAGTGAPLDDVRGAVTSLLSAGHIVRRGHKYFVA